MEGKGKERSLGDTESGRGKRQKEFYADKKCYVHFFYFQSTNLALKGGVLNPSPTIKNGWFIG